VENVTTGDFQEYLEVFHAELRRHGQENLPSDVASALLPAVRFADARVVGYVSTNFGSGFEYVPGDARGISVIRSSSRIEYLLTGAPPRVRRLPVMVRIGGSNAGLSGLTLEGAFPFELSGVEADVRLEQVRFRALGWERIVRYAEIYGERSAEYWSPRLATLRARDRVLAALLTWQRAREKDLTLGDYLSNFRERTVLLLGDYSPEGRKRLGAIREALRARGYDPVLVDEIPDVLGYDLTQKVVAVASVCRFVVIDDSSLSGHLVEYAHVQANRWVAITLHKHGSRGTFMTKGASLTSRVILEREYEDETLSVVVRESADWAEARIAELSVAYANIYPWRAATP
jgi:hypothetical protein